MRKQKGKVSLKQIKKFLPLYIMILPSIVYMFINNYIPMTGIIIAFKKYNKQKGIYFSDWCGLDNFNYLFQNDAAIIIRNTFLYNVIFIILGTIVGVTLAILITNVASKKARKIYQSAIMLPFLISIVIVSYIVFGFLSAENGLINNMILAPLGKNPIKWYSTPKYWPFILTFVNLWKGCGYGTLIYIAGIAGIDSSFFEAARLDGASRWQQIKKITLPCLVPSIITLTVMSVGRIFNSDFGLFYQVPQNSGALYSVTNTIDTYVYRALMSTSGLGRSAAAGFFQSVVGFSLVMVVNGLVRKFNKENAIF
ncbi:ABC transporter permease [Anaerocolumna xylanovorans]|uniref:Putative aldouronate transport system permease protein n=1 Tax=Anaerocolumna xylanovorans DSM 12503 TaxID=1121345 RepID=A0A1M7Y144_9FIRM|nr:ABC transporter permease subunit [Anaerocolumna xylanovorans]SHO45364.1 putative aldouronate transport system permease protein [Anaerocolumna xylanovorans DSM 12503]